MRGATERYAQSACRWDVTIDEPANAYSWVAEADEEADVNPMSDAQDRLDVAMVSALTTLGVIAHRAKREQGAIDAVEAIARALADHPETQAALADGLAAAGAAGGNRPATAFALAIGNPRADAGDFAGGSLRGLGASDGAMALYRASTDQPDYEHEGGDPVYLAQERARREARDRREKRRQDAAAAAQVSATFRRGPRAIE